MSFVNAVPEAVTAAAGDLAGIRSTIARANATAAASTTGIESLAADAVSAALVAVFSAHGLGYQSLGAELAELHEQIVQALRSGGASYAAAESENGSLVQEALGVVGAVDAPAQALLGHPLLGGGTGATPDSDGQPDN
jgi:hypothetical protein